MSTRDAIHGVLDAKGLTPDSARELNQLARAACAADPSVPNFVASSLFRLLSDHWDDSQAVPSHEFQQVQTILLPRLRVWLQSDQSFRDVDEMGRVVVAANNCGLLG
ncbi:MAG: hypothetical protein HYS13_10150 [Planctomycetia bacterium]|nr:hypothetical protein [Planctomycetia bacterium]